MDWMRMLAYITGTVDQELLLRNEYLAAENRILRAQLRGRLLLTDTERATLAEIGHRLGRKALDEITNTARPDTIQEISDSEAMIRIISARSATKHEQRDYEQNR